LIPKIQSGEAGKAKLSSARQATRCNAATLSDVSRRGEDTAALPVWKSVLAIDLELPGFRVDAESREKDAAGFFRALDQFPFHQFANFVFRDAWHGRDDLKVTEAGINFDCCHDTVSLVHRRQASYIPMG
jgi:hypothetical protein